MIQNHNYRSQHYNVVTSARLHRIPIIDLGARSPDECGIVKTQKRVYQRPRVGRAGVAAGDGDSVKLLFHAWQPLFEIITQSGLDCIEVDAPAKTLVVVRDGRQQVGAAARIITFRSMSGPGWICTVPTCTRSDGLIQGFDYPPITVSANVAPNAQTPLVNTAKVSGGGAVSASASDSAIVGSSSPPFGYIDTPLNNATGIAGAIAVTGWALSGVGVQTVAIWRESVAGET